MTEYRHPTLSDEQYNLYLAAPELLAACREAELVLGTLINEGPTVQECLDVVQAAIAKARGEA